MSYVQVCRCFVSKPLTELWQYTCWVSELVSYPRRIRGCWPPSSCGSCLSSQLKIWSGRFSVWEGWTLGSGALGRMRHRFNKNILLTIQGQFAYLIMVMTPSYFRKVATDCVLSIMVGLEGGVNLGGCSLLPPEARWHIDVDRSPGNSKTKRY